MAEKRMVQVKKALWVFRVAETGTDQRDAERNIGEVAADAKQEGWKT